MRAAHTWLTALTSIPTTSGREHGVVAWVERWAGRRTDLRCERDRWGNLLLTSIHPPRKPLIVANAHIDHPGFVATEVAARHLTAEFRGGVRPEYFPGALVEFFDRAGVAHPGRVETVASMSSIRVRFARSNDLVPGDIGRWRFPATRLGVEGDRLRAHACDDLAGAAAALAALDVTRRDPELGHFAVLLTRAEEEGFIGAIGAARSRSVPKSSTIMSIETSRSFDDSPIGGGPILRVGDFSSVFDADLTNRLTALVRERGLTHQRRLMAGGSCEATAFSAYGYRATGLCLALGNYHNMGDLALVEQGRGRARVAPEEISLSDFDGLVAMLLVTARHLGTGGPAIRHRLESWFADSRHLLT
jgi:endoglucanase